MKSFTMPLPDASTRLLKQVIENEDFEVEQEKEHTGTPGTLPP